MQIRILSLAVACMLLSCASLGDPSFERYSTACDNSNIPSCFKAAEYVWNLRLSDLKPCAPNQELCTRPDESQAQAKARLNAKAVDQNGKACDLGKNAEACLRAGSSLAIMSSDMPLSDYKTVADKAEAYFEKACNLGSQRGCRFRGTTYRAGT